MNTITVNTARPYQVTVGSAILAGLGAAVLSQGIRPQKAAVISDDTVYPLYGRVVEQSLSGAGIEPVSFVFPNGEKYKNPQTALDAYSFLAWNRVTRADVIVALGGGVAGDLAGFVAATYQRGIPYMQAPTSLTAALDSSVGGKTGVNVPEGKNLIGAFWQPLLVWCDTLTLETLGNRNFRDGLVEAIKTGCIWDEDLFERLCGDVRARLDGIIARCVAIKAEIVEKDERDNSLRRVLNFGHTLGQAIESLSNYKIPHGRAVAAGMLLAAKAGERAGVTEPGTAARLSACFAANLIDSSVPFPIAEICGAALGDKKREGGEIPLILLARIGEAVIYPVKAERLTEFFEGLS